ncbi:MAG: rhomboid family intramembrane serine protease [Acidimicrobiales bacterium]
MLPLRDDNPTRRVPIVTLVLIVANVAVYLLLQQPANTEAAGGARFVYEYAAIPCEVVTGDPLDADEIGRTVQLGEAEACVAEARPGVDEVFPEKRVWLAVVVSMFLHGSLLHLAGNMLFLWIFGNNIEDRLGPVRYVAFYVAAGVVATLVHIGFQPDSTVPLVGASGAIAGVMGAYLVWFPRARILTLATFFLIEIPALWVLGFWFVSQFFINPMSGVASMAHVGGFVFGVAFGLILRPGRRPPPDRPRSDRAPGRPADPPPW